MDSYTTHLLLKIQAFKVKFVHLAGADNFVADTLSRFPPEEQSTEIVQLWVNTALAQFSENEFVQTFRSEQANDESCMLIQAKIEADNENFSISSGVIYCQNKFKLPFGD